MRHLNGYMVVRRDQGGGSNRVLGYGFRYEVARETDTRATKEVSSQTMNTSARGIDHDKATTHGRYLLLLYRGGEDQEWRK